MSATALSAIRLTARLRCALLAARRAIPPAMTGRRVVTLAGSILFATALAACGGGSPSPSPTVTVTASGTATAAATAPAASASAAAAPPSIVAVTSSGALVTLDPATGTVVTTLVPSRVLGDEITVSSSGLVYFAVRRGCSTVVEAIPAGGGSVVRIATGSLPAISPDGTKLAYADQPLLRPGCISSNPADFVSHFRLAIRTLSSGATTTLPMVPAGQDTGLPAPIEHLSWAPDNDHLAVSIAAVEDNEGWNLVLVDTASAHYYLTGAGTTNVPVTGGPNARDSYLREGVYLPDGDLFVSRACCAGEPVRNTSRLMWEVTTGGTFLRRVAIGYPTLDHTSLDASPDGRWLLYLAGSDLYVSDGGATPRQIASGLIAAAWG